MQKLQLFNLILTFLLVGIINVYSQEKKTEEKKEEFKKTVKIAGNIQYDFTFLNTKDGISPGTDYEFNGQKVRRAHFGVSGSLAKNIKYKADFDLAAGTTGHRDVFVQFVDLPGIGGDFTIGSQAEPTGLEMMTSSNNTTFMERSPITTTQGFRWNSGLAYSNFNILKGKLGFQIFYGFNGKAAEGFKDEAIGSRGQFVTRLTSPVFENKEKNQLVHLGAHYENRKYTKDPTAYSLKFMPENNMAGTISVPFTKLIDQKDFGFELAARFGAFSLQGEYEVAKYNNEETPTTTKIYDVNNFYTSISYTLTGEARGYKSGNFGGIKPKKDFCLKDNSFGAFEVAARYSETDFSSVITTGINDKVGNITLGLNWYLTSDVKIQYNYVITDYHRTGDNNKMSGNLLRLQVVY